MRRAARALAALHQDEVVTPQRRLLRDEVDALEKSGEMLRRACPHLRSEVEEIVGIIVGGLQEVPPAPIHGDLTLRHIMLDDDRLALLDLDEFAEADPVLDVARVLAHLAVMPHRLSFPRDRARATAQVFAEEYFARVPESWRTRLPLHYAAAVLKMARGGLRSQRPGWSEEIEAVVEEAKDSLGGRIW